MVQMVLFSKGLCLVFITGLPTLYIDSVDAGWGGGNEQGWIY